MNIQHLAARARSFRQRINGRRSEFDQLAAGQSPTALFITCSDSRVVPSLITESRPGDLFELRTAGNVIPVYQSDQPSGELATIEYAVEALEVPDIVVCGHSHCGAVRAMVRDDALDQMPTVQGWLTGPRGAVAASEPPSDARTDPALRYFVEQHVLAQLDALRRFPPVARRLAAGQLQLHGWYYRIDSGAVYAYQDGSFQPI